MRKKIVFLLLLFPTWIVSMAQARTVNQHLRQQIENDPNRSLPRGEHYSVAGDLSGFWDVNQGKNDYYHSGYWLNLFGELEVLDRLFLNLKLVATNPSNSYGYNDPAVLIPFLSVSYSDKFFEALEINLLAGDLDRQTLGAGLLYSEKEMSGLLLSFQVSNFRLSWVKPGTGVFNYQGDADIARLDWLEHLVGIYAAQFSLPRPFSGTILDSKDFVYTDMEYKRFFGAYSLYRHESGLYYRVEFVNRQDNNSKANAERFGWQGDTTWVNANLWVENRIYDRGFFDGITGAVDQDYLTVEDRDKEYVNPMNLAPKDESPEVKSGGLTALFFPDSLFRVATRNELIYWSERNEDDKPIYVFDHALRYYAWPGKEAWGSIGYSNIIADAGFTPDQTDLGNHQIHKLIHHFRAEAKVLF